ncbi:MAG: hypothetical protein WAS21_29745 [Geminicoccaceae bacterium]
MNIDGTIDQIATLVRELVAEAERRGEQKALDRIRAAIGVGDESTAPLAARAQQPDDPSSDDAATIRRRAPKGSVGTLVDRALANDGGLTLAEIGATAQNDLERMIAGTSIRAHLKKGEGAGVYREEAGKWYRVDVAQEMTEVPSTTESTDESWSTSTSDT